MTAPMTASELERSIGGLGPVWDTCRALDAAANRTTPRPMMAGDKVRWEGSTYQATNIDATNGVALIEARSSSISLRHWVPLDQLEVVH